MTKSKYGLRIAGLLGALAVAIWIEPDTAVATTRIVVGTFSPLSPHASRFLLVLA